jgi:glycerol-3-phosphate O-acyltransferase/dihydroxyacetone phosphate acyltransferase
MLYRFLKLILNLALRVFFRKVYIRNKHLIPGKGPMIICANHPATFLDPIVIGASVSPELFFLSKGEAFRSPFARWMLPRLNMIPVYRQQDDPSQMHKNKETFIRCFEHLKKGGIILIFPEGVSLTERKLRKLKTGTARIALGAEARNNFNLGVKILNLGLNYTNPHKFNQDLYINADLHIEVSAFKELYAQNEHQAAAELTEQIRLHLEQQIIAVEDEQTDDLVKKIELIYKQQLARDAGLDPQQSDDDFHLTRNIADTVAWFKAQDPGRVEVMRLQIDTYSDNLKRAKLSDEQLNPEGRKESLFFNNIVSFVFLVAGFPVYLFGLLNNWLPFEIPSYLSKRYSPSTDFIGAIALVAGTAFFILFYSLQIFLFQYFLHSAFHTFSYLFICVKPSCFGIVCLSLLVCGKRHAFTLVADVFIFSEKGTGLRIDPRTDGDYPGIRSG